MEVKKGKVEHIVHSSKGNAVLLVVVNSMGPYWHYSIVEETVIYALMHFGMPFRILDLAKERITADTLKNCAAVILAQNLVGGDLSLEESSMIVEAVKEPGIGFVSFDNDIRINRAPLIEMFGFERINPHPYATDTIRISKNGHYITEMQSEGEFHTFDRMLTCISAEIWGEDTIPLAEGILGREQLIRTRHVTPYSAFEPINHPLLFITGHGRGRAVQFTINPRVWRKGYYGHARGIDDLFWRSIIWAVKKPFVANMIPPFISMSMEDCSGRLDFKYVDVCNRYGLKPMPSLFTRLVPQRLMPVIASQIEGNKAEYSTHALDYHNLLFGAYGRGPYTKEEYDGIFEQEDIFWNKIGHRPSPVNRPHLGEWYTESLPYLKERGRIFFSPALQPGVLKLDQNYNEGSWPYDLPTCCYDHLPDDNDFYVFAGGLERGMEDFFTGTTPILRESETLDIGKAATNCSMHMTHGLRSGFFGIARFHEQKFTVVSLDQWDEILKNVMIKISGWEKKPAMLSEIAWYLKNREGTYIKETDFSEKRLNVMLEGDTSGLSVSVFRNEEGHVTREFLKPEENSLEVGC